MSSGPKLRTQPAVPKAPSAGTPAVRKNPSVTPSASASTPKARTAVASPKAPAVQTHPKAQATAPSLAARLRNSVAAGVQVTGAKLRTTMDNIRAKLSPKTQADMRVAASNGNVRPKSGVSVAGVQPKAPAIAANPLSVATQPSTAPLAPRPMSRQDRNAMLFGSGPRTSRQPEQLSPSRVAELKAMLASSKPTISTQPSTQGQPDTHDLKPSWANVGAKPERDIRPGGPENSMTRSEVDTKFKPTFADRVRARSSVKPEPDVTNDASSTVRM